MGEWSPNKGPELVFRWTVDSETKSFKVKIFYAEQEFLEHEIGGDGQGGADPAVPRLSFSLKDERGQPLTTGTLAYQAFLEINPPSESESCADTSAESDWYELSVEDLIYGCVPLNNHVLERCQESVLVSQKRVSDGSEKSNRTKRKVSSKKKATRKIAGKAK